MNHLLIVDDNAMDRELARQVVERHIPLHAQFASNGLEALERLEAVAPIAVLTDLQMPEMDGLELVRRVRRNFPTIPVILMTAHGSEEIALQALVDGAADYVPKHRLAQDLPRVLDEFLGATAGHRRHEGITRRLQYKVLRYAIESDMELIPPLVDQLQQAASSLGLVADGDRARLARALAEALRNAVIHGSGGEPSRSTAPAAKIEVEAEFTPAEARFVIRDNGQGFNFRELADAKQNPGQLTADGGRGLTLIRLFMDEVTFNDVGNEITLKKRGSGVADDRR